MKTWNKVLALILALAVVVSNLPPVLANAAVSSGSINPQTQDTGIRMRQTDFDEETGILTMSVEVATSQLGNLYLNDKGKTRYEGRFVRELYLAFQVDTQSVEPITMDGTAIDAGYGTIGFVGPTQTQIDEGDATDSSFNYDIWQKFTNYNTGMGTRFGSGFNDSMGTRVGGAEVFDELRSGYFTSNNRQSSGLMDCYLHLTVSSTFYDFDKVTDTTDVNGEPLDPGYVKVIDLRFQCYSGDEDSTGTRAPATSENALFCQSIRLPSTVDSDTGSPMSQSEVNDLVSQFYAVRKSSVTSELTQTQMAVGGAGFREATTSALGVISALEDVYAYGIAPTANDWLRGVNRDYTQAGYSSSAMTADPTLSYANMDHKYIVLGFEASFNHTYCNSSEYDGTSDFYNPADRGSYPQYTVPYQLDMDDMISSEKTYGIWKPKAHYYETKKYVPLSYNISTVVSANSVTKPEDGTDGLNTMLHSLEWNFALYEDEGKSPTLLDSFYENNKITYTNPTTGKETVAETVTLYSQTIERTYEVREAFINDSESNYNGCKVQTVRETTTGLDDIDTDTHVTPLGVMLDFSDNTSVTYTDNSGNSVKTTGYAPQLRIEAKAGDTQSYLWLEDLETGTSARKGRVYLQVQYNEPNGGVYAEETTMCVRLHRDTMLSPSYTTIEMDDAYKNPLISSEDNEYIIDVASADADLNDEGIAFHATMYDQYGSKMLNDNGTAKNPSITITAKSGAATGGTVALQTQYDSSADVYYLLYKAEGSTFYGANELLPGVYEISATYTGVQQSGKLNLTVEKDANRFAYMKNTLTLTSTSSGITNPGGLVYGTVTEGSGENEVTELRLSVPAKQVDKNGRFTAQSVKVTFDPVEIANQWRDPESEKQSNTSAYDVVEGLRVDGKLNRAKLLEKFTFEYIWENEDGTQTEITGVDTKTLSSSGSFTYTSEAGVGTHRETGGGANDAEEGQALNVTVKATRIGYPDEVQINKYRIYFVREVSTLKTIKGSWNNSTPGNEVTVPLSVPEEGKTSRETITFLPYDQYDDMMDWSKLSSTWTMKIDSTSMKDANNNRLNSLSGVTLAGSNGSTIIIDDDAVACSFDIYATYGGINSSDSVTNNGLAQKIHVKVSKAASIPAKIQSITSNIIQIEVPNKQATGSKTDGPSIVVKDQYGDVMDPSDYIAKWSFKTPDVEPFTTPSTDKLVSLDIYTGKVTVSPCAKEWKNVVMEVKLYSKSGAYISKINSNNVYRGLQIVRKAQPSVTELDVTTEELAYPLSTATTRSTTLTADAETEYGEKGAVSSDDNVQWILEEVAYKDGSTVSRLQAVIDPATGDQMVDGDGEPMWSQTGQITTDSSTGSIVYTDASRKTISLNRTTGVLTFANGVTNMSWAPVSVTLTCMYSNASVKVTVPIKYNGAALNDEVREPTTMKIPTSLSSVITVPASDEPDQTVELDAQVSDQFGFIIRSESGTNVASNWEITDGMTGVSLNGTTVSVNSYATDGAVTLRATYTLGEKSVSEELVIGIGREPSEPYKLTALGIDELNAADMTTAEIPMPGFTGPNTDDAVSATYTLRSKVEDKNHVHLTAQTVIWQVKNDPYGMVDSISGNKITFKNTDAWCVTHPDTVQIQLTAYDASATSVSTDVTLTLKTQEAYGAYAQPAMETYVDGDGKTWPIYTDESSLKPNTFLMIPSIEKYEANGNKPYEAHFTATVYSQYRQEISGWPAEISYRNPSTLEDTINGLTMESNSLTGKAVLYINTNVDVTLSKIWVVAKPTGENATMVESVNKCDVLFHAGASYQAGIALGTNYYYQAGDRNDDVPTWDAGDDVNFAAGDTYDMIELQAFVHDQRGGNYEAVSNGTAYAVWALGEDTPEGVTFVNPTDDSSLDNKFDSDNNPIGSPIHIWVNSKALQQNELTRDVTVTVWANGKKDRGGDFIKTQKLTLEKGSSGASYHYFNSENIVRVDTADNMAIGETLTRPANGEPASETTVSAVIYDLYGLECSNAAHSITVKTASLPENVKVEQIVPTEEDPATGQRITDASNATLAELIYGTDGVTVKVYSSCTLSNIELELTTTGIEDSKVLRLPIQQQASYASSMYLYDTETEEVITAGEEEIVLERSSDEMVIKQFYAAISDQYGAMISNDAAANFNITWKMKMPGEEEDTWVDYVETDEDGNELPADEKFIQYRVSDDGRTMTMLLNPENYTDAQVLQISCTLTRVDNGAMVMPVQSFTLTVRRRAAVSSDTANGAYIVTYLSGDHGKINTNITTEIVLEGTSPKLIPAITPDEGYAQRGWMLDGSLVRDPGTLQVFSDITLTAQYVKLDEVKFVTGYADGTVRPDQDVTRGEFIRMLVGATTSYNPETQQKFANVFVDVDDEAYYCDYIAYAYFYGIISGYDDGTFRPEEPITRAEAAAMIAKAKGIENTTSKPYFTDLDADSWYTSFAEALAYAGVISGYEDGTFRPKNHLTRAEAITMLVRISDAVPSDRELDNLRKTAEVTFKDLDRDFWAFPYITRAAGVA